MYNVHVRGQIISATKYQSCEGAIFEENYDTSVYNIYIDLRNIDGKSFEKNNFVFQVPGHRKGSY